MTQSEEDIFKKQIGPVPSDKSDIKRQANREIERIRRQKDAEKSYLYVPSDRISLD